MKRTISMILVLVILLTISSGVFAATVTYTNIRVYGGSSQQVYTSHRASNTSVTVSITALTNLQSGFKFRGYDHATGSTCTELSSVITGIGTWQAAYTSLPTVVTVKMSISSANPAQYLTWSGTVAA